MAIEIVYGPPGSGKSFWAVRQVLFDAIESGRHVITNLPVVIEAVAQDFGIEKAQMIHLREKFTAADFDHDSILAAIESEESNPFGVSWIHEDGVHRPLLIIDEAADIFGPKGGPGGDMAPGVHHFIRMHRHFGFDLMLLTQNDTSLHVNVRKAANRFITATNKQATTGIHACTVSFFEPSSMGGKAMITSQKIYRFRAKDFKYYRSRTQVKTLGQKANLKRSGQVNIFLRPIFLLIYFVLGLIFFLFTFTDPFFFLHPETSSSSVSASSSSETSASPPPGLPAPVARGSERLSGYSDGTLYLLTSSGFRTWKRPFEPVPGRCAVRLAGEVVACGELLPENRPTPPLPGGAATRNAGEGGGGSVQSD